MDCRGLPRITSAFSNFTPCCSVLLLGRGGGSGAHVIENGGWATAAAIFFLQKCVGTTGTQTSLRGKINLQIDEFHKPLLKPSNEALRFCIERHKKACTQLGSQFWLSRKAHANLYDSNSSDSANWNLVLYTTVKDPISKHWRPVYPPHLRLPR